MRKEITVNTPQEGMIMDLNPLVTPKNVLTSCLNGTLITYNGNEHVLLNDMGNGRVETAYLSEGYVPLGTTELGGIIYIVSYNPLTDKCQIGSFPSPERNIMINGSPEDGVKYINDSDFIKGEEIIATLKKLTLSKDVLNPGDKFKIFVNEEEVKDNSDNLSAYNSPNENVYENPKKIRLHIVSIGDNGEITYLDDYSKWYNGYYIQEGDKESVDSAKNLNDSGYNIFGSKTSGKLGILALLEVINSFSVGWDYTIDDDKNVTIYFFINWTYDNPLKESKPVINPSDFDLKINGNSVDSYNKPQKPQNLDITKAPPESKYNSENNTFEYIGSFNDQRKNDGSDNDFLIYTNPIPQNTGIINYSITPKMSFGKLTSLTETGSIDLSKIGSDSIELNQWRYYIELGSIQLDCKFDIYLERNKSINYIKFEMFEFNKDNIDLSKINVDTYTEGVVKNGATLKCERTIKDVSNWSKKFIETFNFEELDRDECYLTKITVSYGLNKEVIYYRVLYTTPIFNSAYLESKEMDFLNLKLLDYLKVNTKKETKVLSTIDNQTDNIVTYFSEKLTQSKEYIITDEISKSLTQTVEIKTNYALDLFKINIADSVGNPVTKPSVNITKESYGCNPTQVFIKNKEELKKVEIKGNPNLTTKYANQILTLDISANDTIKTPVKILYDSQDTIVYLNILHPFTIRKSPYYVTMNGYKSAGHNLLLLEVFDGENADNNIVEYKFHLGGDKGDIYNCFYELGKIHEYIKNNSDEDIIPVIYVLVRWDGSKKEFGWYYDKILQTNATGLSNDYGASMGCMLIRNKEDNLNNFPTNLNEPTNSSNVDKYPNYSTTLCDNIKSLFLNYYKLQENTKGVGLEVFKLGDANYYKDFLYNAKLEATINGKAVVTIHDININNSNLPKNLQANIEILPKLEIDYSNQVDVEQFLNKTFDSPKLTGKFVSENTYEPTQSYYNNYNKVYEVSGNSATLVDTIQISSTYRGIKIDRGTLKTELTAPYGYGELRDSASVRFHCDDEGIFIKSFR